MIILGIDPGSRRTGWGVIRHRSGKSEHIANGTIELGEREPLPARLVKLAEALDALIRQHRPEACAIEKVFAAKNARSALVLGQARGVSLCEVARAGVALHEYTATEVKKSVTGSGGADKSQVGRMVRALLGQADALEENAADALALALTHAAASHLARYAGNGR
jgi:crossover junction endodeoxyribonuclease RuvC